MVVQLDCDRITDADSFHAVFADAFGFPGFYGWNWDAWIDCMTWLDDPTAEMTTVHAPPGGVLTLRLDNVDGLVTRCPELFAALVECAAFVNWRRLVTGERAVLALAYHQTAQPRTTAVRQLS